MSLKRYKVVLTGRSALKAGVVKRVWKDPEHKMTIKDDLHKDKDGGPPKHAGLIYTVEVSAEHIVESINKAVIYARHITNQISVVHGVVIDYPSSQFSIDFDQTNADRELAQVLYNVPLLYQPRRTYDHDVYNSFYNLLDKLRQDDNRSAMRIDRAFHYLRSSYLEKDPVDQFEDAWVALEAINPLIREKYCQPTTYQRKCPECKKDLFCLNCDTAIQKADNASGINYIITQLLGKTTAVAKKLRGKRIDIVHARAALSRVLKDIAEKTQLAQSAVMAGVLDLMGFTKDQMASFSSKMLPDIGAPLVIVSAILYDLPVETLRAQASYPQLYLQFCETLKSNRPEAHAGEIRPFGAKLSIGIKNFSGKWDNLKVHSLLEVDPEESRSKTEILTVKSFRTVQNRVKASGCRLSHTFKWVGNLLRVKVERK